MQIDVSSEVVAVVLGALFTCLGFIIGWAIKTQINQNRMKSQLTDQNVRLIAVEAEHKSLFSSIGKDLNEMKVTIARIETILDFKKQMNS